MSHSHSPEVYYYYYCCYYYYGAVYTLLCTRDLKAAAFITTFAKTYSITIDTYIRVYIYKP